MMELEFSFEPSPLEALFAQITENGNISAAQLLMMTEGESEEALQDVLTELEIRHITLDISDMPVPVVTGETAVRLRREAQLVKEGTLPKGLEENEPLRLFLEEIASFPAEGDVQSMAAAYARGQDMVIAKLTNQMLPQVAEVAFGYTGRGVLLMDLIQEGSLGLWQAVLGYQNGDFLAHAMWWIHQYMARAIMLQSRQFGFGQRMKQAMEDYRSVDERLLTDLGRNPTMEEMAEALHISQEEVETVGKMLESARLLSRAKQETAQPEAEDPEEERHVEDTALFQSRQRIEEMLSGLSEMDATLLRLRFGLEGGMPMTPEEVGRKLALTPEEVVTREAAALMQLRNG